MKGMLELSIGRRDSEIITEVKGAGITTRHI